MLKILAFMNCISCEYNFAISFLSECVYEAKDNCEIIIVSGGSVVLNFEGTFYP